MSQPGNAEVPDAVVVGSGFGGSVAAYRLAAAGKRVEVLERGRNYPPGSFPRTPQRMSTNVWAPDEGLHGLFDIWSFGNLDAIVASGVGGGSLIYANVLIRKDRKWFPREDSASPDAEVWPIGRAELDDHYDQVEQMLTPAPFPDSNPAFGALPKAQALARAGARIGRPAFAPDLAVTFGTRPGEPIVEAVPNIHMAPRQTCRMVGECDVGCNYGSKNSMDMTYLARAVKTGNATIHDLCEVTSITPLPDGNWKVDFVRRFPEPAGVVGIRQRPTSETVRAGIVVLAAGALGTTYLLLSNRAALPRLSSCLGQRFSTNGDYLAFLRSDSTGFDPSRGPVITTSVRFPDVLDDDPTLGAGARGFYVQDGGYPAILDWLLEYAMPAASIHRVGRVLATRWWQRLRHDAAPGRVSREVSAMLGSGSRSSGLLPLLAMGRDRPAGRMRLQNDLLDIDWDPELSQQYYRRVRETLQEMAEVLGVEYLDSVSRRLSRAITVHPVGGCPMGADRSRGVVDSYGEVFDYPGLFVTDGSVMPGPVGPNPSFTIAALAERFSQRMVAVLNWRAR